jgi:hypothetical protein
MGIGIAAVLVVLASLILFATTVKHRRRNSNKDEDNRGGGILDSVAITPVAAVKPKPEKKPPGIVDKVEEDYFCGVFDCL